MSGSLTLTPSACAWIIVLLPALCPLPEDRALATLPELPTLLRSPPETTTPSRYKHSQSSLTTPP